MPGRDPKFDHVLVADIGATFARFSVANAGRVADNILTLQRNSAASLAGLCREALGQLGVTPTAAAIAVAGPVSLGHGQLTNGGWMFSEESLQTELGLARVVLLNDFSALALILSDLAPADLITVAPHVHQPVGACADPLAPTARVVFGPGSGLGVGAVMETDSCRLLVNSEGGHAGFSPATELEQALLERGLDRFGRVSWERVLSGPGLQLIDETVAATQGKAGLPARTPQEIIEQAMAGTCPDARTTVDCFAGLLGSFAGELAMTFRASAGVYIGGGLAARMLPLFSWPLIRERFHDKGRHAEWLDTVPLYFIRNPRAALDGAMFAFSLRDGSPRS